MSKNNMLHVGRYLFYELLFDFFYRSDTDFFVTLLRYFICCFSVMKIIV